jgi:predicted site-specific integrase-resolvase
MRIGELAERLGVSVILLHRLADRGVIPAKRLPFKKSHWNFAQADIPKIRGILVDAGKIEEAPQKKK